MNSGEASESTMTAKMSRRQIFGAVAIGMTLAPSRSTAETELRFMNLSIDTVAGRRVTLKNGTIITFHKNHDYTATGTLELNLFGVTRNNQNVSGKGRWAIQAGNTVYLTFDNGRSGIITFWKNGQQLFVKPGGWPVVRIEPVN